MKKNWTVMMVLLFLFTMTACSIVILDEEGKGEPGGAEHSSEETASESLFTEFSTTRDEGTAPEWSFDTDRAESLSGNRSYPLEITHFFDGGFFGETLIRPFYTVRVLGELSREDWCVGDSAEVILRDVRICEEDLSLEGNLVAAQNLGEMACDKPVIYLYPEKETAVSVYLDFNGRLTCTYPAYRNGWKVTAKPDGTLTDENGREYNYLYWEGVTSTEWDFSKGFCVKGEDTAAFLEVALEKLGLTRREANEFIVYWLPLMQKNPYNVISFQTDLYTEAAKLLVEPSPDTVIRIFMTYYASNKEVEIEAQELTAPKRVGFTVVEWGGAEIK